MGKENTKAVLGVSTAREGYEAKVALEALKRGGKNPQLKGIVHEVMFKDALNAKPQNIMNGARAVLSNSTTAVRDDILLKQGGKIVRRMQLKDTANSISKTVKQVADGHYKGTLLMGTEETTSIYAIAVSKTGNITQKMSSTGISSADTARIADKALGKITSATNLASAAKVSGLVGVAISGGVEVLTSGKDFLDGTISGGEFACKVTKAAASGGASGVAATTVSSLAIAGASTLLAETTAPVWVPVAVGVVAAVGVGYLVCEAVNGIFEGLFGW